MYQDQDSQIKGDQGGLEIAKPTTCAVGLAIPAQLS